MSAKWQLEVKKHDCFSQQTYVKDALPKMMIVVKKRAYKSFTNCEKASLVTQVAEFFNCQDKISRNGVEKKTMDVVRDVSL